MTEIKTVRGRGWLTDLGLRDSWESDNPHNVPVVIVHGMTEAGVHEAAALRSACRELGIETVEQLRAKMQPDPRVALLEAVLDRNAEELIKRGDKAKGFSYWFGYEDALRIIRESLIAAQRGEG